MPNTKESLLKRIEEHKQAQLTSLAPYSKSSELDYRRIILDVLEYLLISDTARKLD